MSSYISKAKNPKTEKIEDAQFLDDFYGLHKYGVRFDDGNVYPISEIEIPVLLREGDTYVSLKTPVMNQPIEEKWKEIFVEAGANIEHDRWARWQKHMFSKCDYEIEGEKVFLTLPLGLFDRWNRQIETRYSDLSESEKESDRKETRTYIPLVQQAITTAVTKREKELAEKVKNMRCDERELKVYGKEYASTYDEKNLVNAAIQEVLSIIEGKNL